MLDAPGTECFLDQRKQAVTGLFTIKGSEELKKGKKAKGLYKRKDVGAHTQTNIVLEMSIPMSSREHNNRKAARRPVKAMCLTHDKNVHFWVKTANGDIINCLAISLREQQRVPRQKRERDSSDSDSDTD